MVAEAAEFAGAERFELPAAVGRPETDLGFLGPPRFRPARTILRRALRAEGRGPWKRRTCAAARISSSKRFFQRESRKKSDGFESAGTETQVHGWISRVKRIRWFSAGGAECRRKRVFAWRALTFMVLRHHDSSIGCARLLAAVLCPWRASRSIRRPAGDDAAGFVSDLRRQDARRLGGRSEILAGGKRLPGRRGDAGDPAQAELVHHLARRHDRRLRVEGRIPHFRQGQQRHQLPQRGDRWPALRPARLSIGHRRSQPIHRPEL